MIAAILPIVAAVILAVAPIGLALGVAAASRVKDGVGKPDAGQHLYRQKHK